MNLRLCAAIARHNAPWGQGSRREVFAELLGSTLLLGVRETGARDGLLPWDALLRDPRRQILVIHRADGYKLLPVFSDFDHLHVRNHHCAWIASPALSIFRRVSDDVEFDGVVVNPDGPSFEIDRHEIADFVIGGRSAEPGD